MDRIHDKILVVKFIRDNLIPSLTPKKEMFKGKNNLINSVILLKSDAIKMKNSAE